MVAVVSRRRGGVGQRRLLQSPGRFAEGIQQGLGFAAAVVAQLGRVTEPQGVACRRQYAVAPEAGPGQTGDNQKDDHDGGVSAH